MVFRTSRERTKRGVGVEEKERYELFGEHCIKDNDTNARCQLLDVYKTCVILNEQDKEIQQLKQSIKEERENLQQLYSHLGVEAFGEDIQEQAVKEIDKLKQSQKQLAIEELEKVKADINAYNKEHCFLFPEIDTCNKSVEIIDNQIKNLKEKNNDTRLCTSIIDRPKP